MPDYLSSIVKVKAADMLPILTIQTIQDREKVHGVLLSRSSRRVCALCTRPE